MQSISDSHARVQEWKRKSPLRVTRARVSVAEVLLHQDQPLSAELVFRELLDKGEDVSLGSVYRILKQMEDEGLVQRERQLSYGGYKAVYSIYSDAARDRAYWFCCDRCGRRQRVPDTSVAGHLFESAALERYSLPAEIIVTARCDSCA
jgi:Fur family ferric uptake transcriptional regulator